MSGRVLNFESSDHTRTLRLLPWYANGTLDDDDSQRITRHLAECAECRGELDELRCLQGYCMQSPTVQAHEVADAEPSLARLRQRLQPPHPARTSRWQGLLQNWSQAPSWLRFALAAQFCAVFALAGVLVGQERSGLRRTSPSSPLMYRTLGVMEPARRAGEATLVVMFQPHLRHADVQRLLLSSQARIVDGPSDAGAYVLAVPVDRRDAALAALRREPGVAMAETLDAGERR
ncbi:zf-HC2 domain-containing protein [Lysobacter niastensis]|uniref:Zf-HC2 domain-containing protein n=1 Tax=Lysobacter niastensis TaxID=380629 RepID=A0ABS0B5M1_9GAMM|nr:zf-HC2 domain-containing protein [Lysobacter niastensis]MBF6024166.1 zf-HC2 domain-containing protein [Lysobacter niastensis]